MKKILYIVLCNLILWNVGWAADTENREIPSIEFKGMTFLQVDMNPHLRVYLTKEEYEQYKKEGAPEFSNKVNKAMNLLSEHKVPYPKGGYYQFLVVPKGEVFKKISGLPFTEGIGGLEGWPEVLTSDDRCFFALNPKSPLIGIVHELAHLIHGNWIEIYPICEGFAEAVPFYILNLKDEKQQEIALNLTAKELYSVNTLIKRGMFIEPDTQAQYRKTYVSMYLWMRGYLEMVQQKYNLDKLQALTFVLQEFQKAAALPTLKKQENYIAKLIGWKRKQVFDRIELQLIGQQSLLKSLNND